MREAAPIFVAGLDHSGKTALRAALNAHPDIHVVRHVELWTRLRAWFDDGHEGRRRVVEALTSGKAHLELDREHLLAEAAEGDFRALVNELGRQICSAVGKGRWGLQEALLEFQAGTLLHELPDARVIMLVRDPRTRYAEMRQRGTIGRGGLAAETAAWIASARAGAIAAAERPHAFHVIRHEALMADPETTLTKVCAFIDEPFVPAMVDALPAPLPSAPLGERQAAFIQAHAAAEMATHGYPLAPVPARPGMLPQRLADASRWQLGRLSWRRRTRHLPPSLAWE